MKICLQTALLLFGLLCLPRVYGQQSQETFGKNRVQYQDFSWSMISTDNFDIYYYPQSKTAALIAAQYAEFEFDKITEILGYAPYSRIKLIVYATHSDLIQSNIGLSTEQVFVGGYAVFLKNRVEVAFNGLQSDFKKHISMGVATLILNEMLYGNGFSEVLKSAYFLSLPEWFLSGLVMYLAEGWSTELDDRIREIFTHEKFKKPNNFSGDDAATIGASVWNFVAEKYGKVTISNVLNNTRFSKKYESSFREALAIPYKKFIREWRAYYVNQVNPIKDSLAAPDPSNLLTKRTKAEVYYGSIRISPDGTRVTWVQNDKGRYKVIVKNLLTGRQYVVYRGGYRTYEQKNDYKMPVVAWRNNDKVGVISVRHDKMKLVTYDIKMEIENNKERFRLEASNFLNIRYSQKQTYRGIYKHFKQLNDFSFSEDGATILISGENTLGQSDIFYYNLRNNLITPITNDIFDDRNPHFLPKTTKSFVFSSNRTTDSLRPKAKIDYRTLSDNHDIFLYHADSSSTYAKRIVRSKYNDISPRVSKNGDIYYLSDKNGIYELYKLEPIQKRTSVMSNYRKSILSYDLNAKQSSLAFIMEEQGKTRLYLDTTLKSKSYQDSLPKTVRLKEIENKNITYTSYSQLQPKETHLTQVYTLPELQKSKKKLPLLTDSTDIDVDNYVFEFEKISQSRVPYDTFLTPAVVPATGFKKFIEIKPKLNEIYISSPTRYRYDFGIDNVTTSLRIDPLRGWGPQAALHMSDIMSQHRINGYFFGSFDFNSSIMSAEYEYLKNRTDFKFKVLKDVYYRSNTGILGFALQPVIHRYSLYKYESTISYPINPKMRISGTPFYARTVFQDLLVLPDSMGIFGTKRFSDQYTDYVGTTCEYVYDNTRNFGVNVFVGTRAKLGVSYYFSPLENDKSFGKFNFDIRNYSRIHREVILAQRISGGAFIGHYNVNFLMGGMDNWLFNSLHPTASEQVIEANKNIDQRELLFADFVTNMRGFPYGRQFGRNYLIYNIEIRVPFIRYLIRRQIGWSFFRNLMLTGFYDLGLSWTGRNPITAETNINTFQANIARPFSATVTDYRNPLLSGYGFGFRSMIMGFYTKLDFAWGVYDFVTQPVRVYLTLGYDF